MDAELDPRFSDRTHPVQVEVLRRKTPGQRMKQALESNEFVRGMIVAMLRRDHPEWNDEEIRRQLIRRVLGDTARLIETHGSDPR